MAESDITGQKFGRLTVLAKSTSQNSQGQSHWVCVCDCGGMAKTTAGHLRSGHSQSCGCVRRERTVQTVSTHGKSRSAEHTTWLAMRQRCLNPKNKNYPTYGGSGVTICQRWDSFENFFADMGTKPSPKHTIDRIDPSLGYDPANCRWSIQYVQVINRNVRGKYGLGVTRTLTRRGTPRFKASITLRGKRQCLGTFDTPEEAQAAYLEAANRIYGAAALKEALHA